MIPRSEAAARGAVAGAVGGLVASWAMTRFERLWPLPQAPSLDAPAGSGRAGRGQDEDAERMAARTVAKPLLGRPLSEGELRIAAPLLHYTFGALMGAVYGAAAADERRGDLVTGMAFGATLWLAGDETVLPALAPADTRRRYTVGARAQALAGHVVYGAVLDLVRSAIAALESEGCPSP